MKKRFKEVAGDYSMTGTRRMQAPGNIRAGFLTTSPRTSTVTDSEFESQNDNQDVDSFPKSSLVFVTKNGKILAVSRGSNMSDMNMPGGGVELNEDPTDAAIREMREETGLIANDIFPIYSAVSNGYLTTTYRVTSFSGKLRPSSEGIPDWVEPETLLRSSYGEYFTDMLHSLHGDIMNNTLKAK